MSELQSIQTQGGGYGPPPGGYGPPPGGAPPGGYPPQGGGYGPPPGGYGGPPQHGQPPGGYGGPPPGWQPPGGPPPGGPGQDLKKQATTWLIVSAVTFFFCGGNCLSLAGAILCFLAMQASDSGNLQDAESKLKLGKTLTIVGIVLTIVAAIGFTIYYFVVMAAVATGAAGG
jgi:hypothetical protein